MAWMITMAFAAAQAAMPMAGMARPAVACPATPAPLPPALAGWARQTPVAGAAGAAQAPALTIGAGAQAALLPMPAITFAIPPGKPGAATDQGGLFAVAITAAGRYRVVLGAPAWIDVVQDGNAVQSVAHDRGPDCTGIRKMADFDLKPGHYLLQVAGSTVAAMPLMVARLP